MPILRAVLMTRQAISPRLAIRILLNIACVLFRNSLFTQHRDGGHGAEHTVRSPMSACGTHSSSSIQASHPEHAELRRRDRRVQRRREREAEHASRLGGVDVAVAVEPRARVVRMSLVLVLLEERRLERALVVVGPGAAARLDAVALDRR